MISEWEIRLNAAKLGVERAKYGRFSIPTFESIHLFERYLRGVDALVLANELDELTTFIQDRSNLLNQLSHTQVVTREPETLSKKKWWQI